MYGSLKDWMLFYALLTLIFLFKHKLGSLTHVTRDRDKQRRGTSQHATVHIASGQEMECFKVACNSGPIFEKI